MINSIIAQFKKDVQNNKIEKSQAFKRIQTAYGLGFFEVSSIWNSIEL